MEATCLEGRQPEMSCVKYRSQGAMAKHLVIARDSTGRKPTSKRFCLSRINPGRWDEGGERGIRGHSASLVLKIGSNISSEEGELSQFVPPAC